MEDPSNLESAAYKNQDNPAVTITDDLLWTIFNINSRVFNHSPLEYAPSDYVQCQDDTLYNLRSWSQTCSAWRTLILKSSSLWGRAIDLDRLFEGLAEDTDSDNGMQERRGSPEPGIGKEKPGRALWLNEVLRRSQKSPLWVRGSYVVHPALVRLTVDLLKNEWHRLERLVVDIKAPGFDSEFKEIVTRPAPCLQQYHLDIFGIKEDFDIPPASIFGRHAPFLRSMAINNFRITAETTWISNLHILVIKKAFTISQLLGILGGAAALSFLHVTGIHMNATDTHMNLPLVRLPHLKIIQLLIESKAAAILLRHLVPAPTCSLSVRCVKVDLDELEKHTFHPIISFFKNAIVSHSPHRLDLTVSRDLFMIQLGSMENEVNFVFEYSDFWGSDTNPTRMKLLIDAFSMPEIGCVTEFYYNQFDKLGTDFLRFEALSSLLPHVVVFSARESILVRFFRAYFKENHVGLPLLFPLLHTIRVERSRNFPLRVSNELKDILERLRSEGRPLNILDVTKCNPEGTFSFRNLESISGLKVLWTSLGSVSPLEYVCGQDNK